jgi:hypothetical protein
VIVFFNEDPVFMVLFNEAVNRSHYMPVDRMIVNNEFGRN